MLIYAMVCILLTWLVSFAALGGLGLLFMSGRSLTLRGLFPAFWLGYAATIALLELWHLFWPVTSVAPLLLVMMALAGWYRHRKRAWRLFTRCVAATSSAPWAWGGSTLVILSLLWLANRATASSWVYDTGLYHWNVVRWTVSHPIIPGLVNLHPRLAFNNADLLFPALFESAWWHGRSNHVATGVLVIGLLVPALLAAVRLLRGRRADAWHVYLCATLLPVAMVCSPNSLSSHSPDIHSLLVLLAAGLPLVVMTMTSFRPDVSQHRLMLYWATAGTALAVTHKLSTVFFMMPAMAVIFLILFRHGMSKKRCRVLAIGALLAGMLLLPWMVRGVILSGYPVYPFEKIALPVDWREPVELARHQRLEIKAWARLNFGDTQQPWWLYWPGNALFKRVEYTVLPGMMLAMAVLCLCLFKQKASGFHSGSMPVLFVIGALPGVIGIAGSMATAPDPRFFGASTWYLVIWVFTTVVLTRREPLVRRLMPAVVFVMAVAWLAIGAKLARQPLIYAAGPDAGLHPEPTPPLGTFITRDGQKVYIPLDYRQNDRVWDSALPATTMPNPRLELRTPGDLRSGFRQEKPPNPPSPSS